MLNILLYIIGVIFLSLPFLLINYLQIQALNTNISITFTLLDYINLINPLFIAFILIAPAIIIDKVQNTKLLYSIGLNFDKFAIRDIVLGIFSATISVLLISNIIFHFAIPEMNTILTILFLVFIEELLFRGYIFQTIYRKNNSILAIIISSLLFALAHFISYDFAIIYFLNIFIAGVLLCIMYIKTKSLWCSISFHFIWNILTANTIEHHYLCGIILIILILVVLKLFRPSYKINSYYLLN